MLRNNWSRKEVLQYIKEGGLEMEQFQAEQNRPIDEAFEKIKAQGPPKWFCDMFDKLEGSGAGAEGEIVSDTSPTTAQNSAG